MIESFFQQKMQAEISGLLYLKYDQVLEYFKVEKSRSKYMEVLSFQVCHNTCQVR